MFVQDMQNMYDNDKENDASQTRFLFSCIFCIPCLDLQPTPQFYQLLPQNDY